MLAADLSEIIDFDEEEWETLGDLAIAEGLEGLLYWHCIRSAVEMPSEAGGLNTTALRDDIRIIRPGEVKPEMFTVDFKRITTHGDLEQNVVLINNGIIFVPRSFMGDVNDVITKIEPLLNVLLIPATYPSSPYNGRWATGGYWSCGCDGPHAGFTRPLPGVSKLAMPFEDEEQQEEDREAVE